MKIVIVGSTSCSDKIELVRKNIMCRLMYRGNLEVVTPTMADEELINAKKEKGSLECPSFFEFQKNYIAEILSASLIVAVPKDDETFGESTSYEMALADHFGKPIYIWTELGEWAIWGEIGKNMWKADDGGEEHE